MEERFQPTVAQILGKRENGSCSGRLGPSRMLTRTGGSFEESTEGVHWSYWSGSRPS